MAYFKLLSEWSFAASIEQVWELIADGERYPRWWPAFRRAEPVSGGGVHYRLKSGLGYTLDFFQSTTKSVAPRRLVLRAQGDLVGTGALELSEEGAGTRVRFLWDVDLGRRWLRWLSRVPGMKGLFERSHRRVMEQGRRRLLRELRVV
jgi:uncharacterized protein YndB with AHSA1/START domain